MLKFKSSIIVTYVTQPQSSDLPPIMALWSESKICVANFRKQVYIRGPKQNFFLEISLIRDIRKENHTKNYDENIVNFSIH